MNTNTNNTDYSVTSFDHVVVEKERLLKTLRENRDAHNEIYNAACSGYWIRAKEVIEEKQKEFDKALKKMEKRFDSRIEELDQAVNEKNLKAVGSFSSYFEFNSNWPLSYPSNHLSDYERVINMLEFSVADKVKLTARDFNAYVRNDWEWRDEFSNTNLGYVAKAYSLYNTGAVGLNSISISGCLPSRTHAFLMSGSAGFLNNVQ